MAKKKVNFAYLHTDRWNSMFNNSVMKNCKGRKSTLETDDEGLEHTLLIWLDASANLSAENTATQIQFRAIIHYFKTFATVAECEECIRSKSPVDRIFLISSGVFGQELIPRISALRQLACAYVYCRDKKKNEEWSKHCPKVIVFRLWKVFLFPDV